ncbi:MAG: carboxypeptidase-like regulatory domain-containing protein [Patescibacteria group bacterium]
MRKFFSTLLFLGVFLILLPIFVQAEKITNINSIMDQGSTRTCLHGKPDGPIKQPNKSKQIAYATLNLDGQCIAGSAGCEIWLHNSENMDIDVNERILKDCKNGSTRNYCNDTTHEEDELAAQVDVKPGWTQVTDFTFLSSKPGETIIAIGDGNKKGNVFAAEPGTVPNGDVKIQVSSKYAAHVNWSYYAIGDGQTLPTEMGAGAGTPVDDQNPSQQLGTVNNVGPTINLTQEGLQEDCVTFYWDPYGRVFDSQSLEPMSGIRVNLLDDKGKPAVIDGPFPNYGITKIDNGIYNILVSKEADYQMSVNSPATHLFTRNVTLHPNYSTIYSDIYLPGDIFHEVPIPVNPPKDFDFSKYHHDIPLVAKGTPYIMPVEDVFVIKSSVISTDMGSFVNFKGRVTFPRAKVCLVGKETKKVYGNCVNGDKYGNFTINIDKNKIAQEYLYIIAEKVNLTLPIIKSNNIDISKINFQDENLTGYEPILNYVEGYAYDDAGKAMPKAKITVKLIDSDTVFYTTTADDTGFFTIYGKNLPFPEYYFEISDGKGGAPKVVTTSKFIETNKSYLESEKLNLMNSTKNNQPIINPATGQLNEIEKNINKTNSKEAIANTIKNIINSKFIFVLLILVLLVPITIGMVLYIKKNK